MGISSLGGGEGSPILLKKKFRGRVWISQIGTPLQFRLFLTDPDKGKILGVLSQSLNNCESKEEAVRFVRRS
jgi:hypothetical protein